MHNHKRSEKRISNLSVVLIVINLLLFFYIAHLKVEANKLAIGFENLIRLNILQQELIDVYEKMQPKKMVFFAFVSALS